MIDIIDIDDLFVDGCFKRHMLKFGYTLNLCDFVRYHFEHRIVDQPDYENETYVFIPIHDPEKIVIYPIVKKSSNGLHLSSFNQRVRDSENLNIVVSFPMETYIDETMTNILDRLVKSYPKAKIFFSQANANVENRIVGKISNRIKYLPNPMFEAHYGDHIRNTKLISYKKTPIQKKFLVPIRQAKYFRIAIYMWMKEHAILENSYYSWLTENVNNNDLQDVIRQSLVPRELTPEDIYFLGTPVSLDSDDKRIILHKQWDMSEKVVSSSFMQIVLETTFNTGLIQDNPIIFLTEKTYKPIFYKQPFILISEPYSLKYLRNLGYKTFGSFIDESYDEIEDPVERMKCITNEILKINSMSLAQLENIRVMIHDIVEHNYNVFMSRPTENILVKHIEETLLYGKQRSIKLISE